MSNPSLFYLLHQRKHPFTPVGKRKTPPILLQGSLNSSRRQIKRNWRTCYCIMCLHCIMRWSVCRMWQLSLISKRLRSLPPWSHRLPHSSQPLLPHLLQLKLLQELVENMLQTLGRLPMHLEGWGQISLLQVIGTHLRGLNLGPLKHLANFSMPSFLIPSTRRVVTNVRFDRDS